MVIIAELYLLLEDVFDVDVFLGRDFSIERVVQHGDLVPLLVSDLA